MFCRRITVCGSYQYTWMSGSVLCLADGDPWIQATSIGRATGSSGAKSSQSIACRAEPRLSVDPGPVEQRRGTHEELLARCDVVAHQQLEDSLRVLDIAQADPAQRAGPRVHCGFGQLVRVHLTQTLVALDRLPDLLAAARQVGHRA